jgi:hypothetical protein
LVLMSPEGRGAGSGAGTSSSTSMITGRGGGLGGQPGRGIASCQLGGECEESTGTDSETTSA